jgi:hypothetical protein
VEAESKPVSTRPLRCSTASPCSVASQGISTFIEGQPRVECRKTCGRGVKRTQILGMGYSTPRPTQWQESSACRKNEGYSDPRIDHSLTSCRTKRYRQTVGFCADAHAGPIKNLQEGPCDETNRALYSTGSDNGHYVAHDLALLNAVRTYCGVEKGALAKNGHVSACPAFRCKARQNILYTSAEINRPYSVPPLPVTLHALLRYFLQII